MFRKQDFKKIDLLGSGKKNTKIYKAEHIPTGKIYAIKEIEARNLEKLNEYKEEAVQLSKAQSNANILNFYGYYFYETMYNTYRLALVIEFLDQKLNFEYLFRKRKQQNKYWKEAEFYKMVTSLVQTFCFLQQLGICHRDIKPANLFLLPTNEVKVIDFGESKDYLLEEADDPQTVATIRGTPQYLSPILWKAHVEEGNTRHAKHNIYKSDVFSSGLVLYQMGSMEDVTGFNQKNHIYNGEKLIEKGMDELRKRYSDKIVEIVGLMLKFEEKDRFTFVELAKHIFGSNVIINTPSKLPKVEEKPKVKKEPEVCKSDSQTEKVEIRPHSITANAIDDDTSEKDSGKLMTQTKLFESYCKANQLIVNRQDFMVWFEYGGSCIGKQDLSYKEEKWKLLAKYKYDFSTHFIVVCAEKGEFYLLGPNHSSSCILFKDSQIIPKAKMPVVKSFFSGIYLDGIIYTFGGYDNLDKIQLKSCEQYNVSSDTWTISKHTLVEARSQSSACASDKTTFYIFGGYNKSVGTLNSIEKMNVADGSFTLLKIEMPTPLRRFASIKIAPNKILLLGGIQRLSKESDYVYYVDFEEHEAIERLDRLAKAGVIEYPILVDNTGNLHLYIEEKSGTAPPYHITYSFLEYS
jgi:serine/threonine protein kinase